MNLLRNARLVASLSLVVGLAVVSGACGKRMLQPGGMQVGEKVLIKPATGEELLSLTANPPRHALVSFEAAGVPLSFAASFEVAVYGADAASPLFIWTNVDLQKMAKSGECPAKVLQFAGAIGDGDALFCNGVFDSARFSRFVLRRDRGDDRSATLPVFSGEDRAVGVVALTVDFQ